VFSFQCSEQLKTEHRKLKTEKERRFVMNAVTIQEAQAKLPDLIHNLTPGEELVITENNQPVAKLVSEKPAPRQRPGPGLCKGMITIVADDDEHLEHFKEYMP
jgi:antitoxin (DNA-binding transcriptional repressor) of toxin-antitoxin stability system